MTKRIHEVNGLLEVGDGEDRPDPLKLAQLRLSSRKVGSLETA